MVTSGCLIPSNRAELVAEEVVDTETAVNENVSDQHQTTEDVLVENEVAEEASEHQECQASLFITDVDDEICDDENYYNEIDPGTAFTCLQCNMEYFPASYTDGDKVNKWAVCRWHLGVSKCVNCGRIRDHRRLCLVPSLQSSSLDPKASPRASPVAYTILDNLDINLEEA